MHIFASKIEKIDGENLTVSLYFIVAKKKVF